MKIRLQKDFPQLYPFWVFEFANLDGTSNPISKIPGHVVHLEHFERLDILEGLLRIVKNQVG